MVKKANISRKTNSKKATKLVSKKGHNKVKAAHKSVTIDGSFVLMKEKTPFMSRRITMQTVYWAVLLAYILLLSLWILKIQIDTQTILDKLASSLLIK
ncbi:hypothetical protein HGB24_00985 [Candidatus Saccharibacteria bacterium]|nr:hypothetical protein [Candidatus Saccharibacteria bacterium]